jgi:hypothetical protein
MFWASSFFATIVLFCYDVSDKVSGEFPTRSVFFVYEPFFATIGLILLSWCSYGSKSGILGENKLCCKRNIFLLLWYIMVAKAGFGISKGTHVTL